MPPAPPSTLAVARKFAISSLRPWGVCQLARLPRCCAGVSLPSGSQALHSGQQQSQKLPRGSRRSLSRATFGSLAATPTSPLRCTHYPLDRRCYHSFDRPNEPPPKDAFSSAEQAILAAAARHIPVHGFSERTLVLGAHDAGYPGISTAILPDGVFSLVRWHLVNQRTSLAVRTREIFVGAVDGASAGVSGASDSRSPRLSAEEIADRAEQLTWERLMGNKEVVGRWQEALAIMAQPSYVPASLRELALLADEIWALAGDTTVDPSWYTKRAAVSAIYAASELYMTTDDSGPDFAATRAFLQRRFQESQELGGYVQSVGQWISFAASAGVSVLRSKGVGI